MKPAFLLAYRVVTAALAVGVVALQMVNGYFHPSFDYPNYLSYFTIQSNLFAAGILIAAMVSPRADRWTWFRGAATVYLSLTGGVYFLLLAGREPFWTTPGGQTNAVLHYAVPLLMLADWWFAPGVRVHFRAALWWLVYPLLFVSYSLLRGMVTGWYPYPFLDASAPGGYVKVAIVCAVLAAWLAAYIGVLTRARRTESKQE